MFFIRFLTVVGHFRSHFGVVLGYFWALGMSLDYLWETLGVVWLQLGDLGCSLDTLGPHLDLRNRFLIDF